jgi:uncharacterized membrane protein YqhA
VSRLLQLIGAIVAISAVELLKAFLVSQNYTDSQLAWKVGIHFTFVLSGVFFRRHRLHCGKQQAKVVHFARGAVTSFFHDRGMPANPSR